MLTISLIVFTACESEEEIITPNPILITVLPAEMMYAGQTGETTITISWDHSPSSNQTWFKGYELTISAPGETDVVKELGKTQFYSECSGLNKTKTYTFTIVAIGIDTNDNVTEVKSSVKTIDWALASHFSKNDVGADIKIYVKESSNYGSGLNLFDQEGAPSNWKVANGSRWNLALGSKSDLVFGTASSVKDKVGFNNFEGTPADAEIAIPNFDNDTDVLTDLQNTDLSKFSYSKQYIDLNSSSATSKSDGFMFFARTGTPGNYHYARIIVLKKGGKYLQDETTSDPYIQVLVSYQTRANVPYAKTK